MIDGDPCEWGKVGCREGILTSPCAGKWVTALASTLGKQDR